MDARLLAGAPDQQVELIKNLALQLRTVQWRQEQGLVPDSPDLVPRDAYAGAARDLRALHDRWVQQGLPPARTNAVIAAAIQMLEGAIATVTREAKEEPILAGVVADLTREYRDEITALQKWIRR